MYWLTGRQSQLNPENKLLINKTIIKPIWTYGIELWGTTTNSHVKKIESVILRTIINAPWYIHNEEFGKDLGIPTVKEEIERYCGKYKTDNHPNELANDLYKTSIHWRLHKTHPIDLLMKE